ncbi:hypothetical protein RN001_009703 [Aquatica leii]|uniref:hydroxyisourate hydrolase n=1 Tax=Aquatica leii TaxID=1421715 RepID=A0AAN7P5K7_9COLE|nr:hypothetical protein RN001_009703 [Aquatica leii]
MENQEDEESRESSQSIKVIHLHLDDSVLSATASPSENSGVIKGKYYKQTYRTAWEKMPDFRGWLRGVQGQPTRAYCLYCQKTLHAHRLSLLKHTCTIRHQKAAQIHNIRQTKGTRVFEDVELQGDEEEEPIVEYSKCEDGEPEEEEQVEQEEDVEEEEEESIQMDSFSTHLQKHYRQNIVNPMASIKPPISTHVLDTCKGVPVSGLQVSLYKLIDGRWTYINEGITNPDGRFTNFLERSDFTPGRYKLHYDVDRFFEAKKQDTLYPFIEIVFDARAPNDHYHVPLLLSPYGYTTYRGS